MINMKKISEDFYQEVKNWEGVTVTEGYKAEYLNLDGKVIGKFNSYYHGREDYGAFLIEDLCPPDGLDVRDMLALQYIKMQSPGFDENGKNVYKDAYQFADNMLKARIEKPE
ncbi:MULTISPECIES: hypothetical protein [Citrobacter freundii complex]|uniref:hypothetical protein n=1 Tax=Citrobacter freundii complex TaxID=1344959 RepID=UPI0023B29271|nr:MULTISPECIES: hypothetical protein [Citrobacter]MDE9718865.1 hypothetical protein [Citrobacter cronae]MEB2739474.1 hypothetical protein [Citrobacter portucalensis]HBU8850448.1 hypothetical protein [Citrobacter sedlakii]